MHRLEPKTCLSCQSIAHSCSTATQLLLVDHELYYICSLTDCTRFCRFYLIWAESASRQLNMSAYEHRPRLVKCWQALRRLAVLTCCL